MGISGIGPGSLLLILAIVLLVFGTKRLRNIGSDLGGAVKGFKDAMSEEEKQKLADQAQKQQQSEEAAQDTKQDKDA